MTYAPKQFGPAREIESPKEFTVNIFYGSFNQSEQKCPTSAYLNPIKPDLNVLV